MTVQWVLNTTDQQRIQVLAQQPVHYLKPHLAHIPVQQTRRILQLQQASCELERRPLS